MSITKNVTFAFLFWLLGTIMYHKLFICSTIDARANRLGLMEYCSEENRMVAKMEYRRTLFYLKNGKMR